MLDSHIWPVWFCNLKVLMPKFTLDRERIFGRISSLAGIQDIELGSDQLIDASISKVKMKAIKDSLIPNV